MPVTSLPASAPAADESTLPVVRRALQRARLVGHFAVVQAVVQALGFASGILIVRTLEQREYAYFTIANTMQGTLNLLADIGISVGLISIGGRVWQDRHRFGELINTALSLRKQLGALVIVAVTPVMYLMLVRNGASVLYTAALILIILIGFLVQPSIGVLGVVPRLRSDIGRIQLIDFVGAAVRLSVLALVMLLFLNAGVAVAIATVTLFLQYAMLRSYVAGAVDLSARVNAEDRNAMLGFVRKLAANAIFYCFQGQITVFLITFFGHRASSIAEVGALGRLAMIFALVSNLLMNVFVPAFARCQSVIRLRLLYTLIVGGIATFSVLVICAAAVFPEEFLFALGNRYAHLHQELVLMVSATVLNALAGALWALNSSKAWIAGSWLYIPMTLLTQIGLVPFIDFSSVSGVLLFNLISVIPSLILNIGLSYRGFRTFTPAIG